MIYVNDEQTVFAKKSPITGEEEPGTKKFRDDDTVILESRLGMNPGDRDKVTVVIWLEGDDPECINSILGGEIKMHMDIHEEHVEEKNRQ